MLRLLRWLFLGWGSWVFDKLGSEADPLGAPHVATPPEDTAGNMTGCRSAF